MNVFLAVISCAVSVVTTFLTAISSPLTLSVPLPVPVAIKIFTAPSVSASAVPFTLTLLTASVAASVVVFNCASNALKLAATVPAAVI